MTKYEILQESFDKQDDFEVKFELGQCLYISESAGSELQTDGAIKLRRKKTCLNDLRFRFGVFSSFSFEDRSERNGS